MKISYAQLENVPTKVLYEANLKTMNPNSLLKKEVNPEMFDELLDSHGYDPSVSVAAFDEDTGECVGMVLNGIRKDRRNTAYDILTCTIPEYRRMGIAKTIFEKVIPLLKEKGFTTYTTETKRTNLIAQNMYRSIGFEITKEVVTTLKTQDGTREVEQYELVMKLWNSTPVRWWCGFERAIHRRRDTTKLEKILQVFKDRAESNLVKKISDCRVSRLSRNIKNKEIFMKDA